MSQKTLSPAPTPPPSGARLSFSQRILLTWQYHGPRAVALRALTFPLRFTPLAPRAQEWAARLGSPRPQRREAATAQRWYRQHGRPVTIVIPSYRDIAHVRRLVAGIRKTTDQDRVTIVISDDASGPDHLAALRLIPRLQIVSAERNGGFAANVNRGLAVADKAHDIVLLNSDIIPTKRWLAALQYYADNADVGITTAKLLYPDNRIQYAGTIPNLGAPEWFDHRHRFQAADHGPANVVGPTLAATGACMYIKRETLERVGDFDEGFAMAYEDVDYCLRAWQLGLQTLYVPAATLVHLESQTRGTEQNERELSSQRHFWEKWSDFLLRRNVHTSGGRLKVVYVTEDTGVGGGHRDIFEHLNGLIERGHDAELWTLGEAPDWFPLAAPVRSFASYDDLVRALSPVEAIKVATWWNTAQSVWLASRVKGTPVYFVQDIETSYYRDEPELQSRVLDSYRPEFSFMTISSWNRDRLRELGLEAELIPPGIDLGTFRPRPEVSRREDMILALGRGNPLKNLGLTLAAWRALPEPRPRLTLFGIEPHVTEGDPDIDYVVAPSDDEVAELFSAAAVFVQTSIHEGFCLPPLESMATGGAVLCTDAHGNRDFCVDGQNCLMPDPTMDAVNAALRRLLSEPDLRARLGSNGMTTAADYAWPRRIDALENFLTRVATLLETVDVAVPGARRTLH